MIEHVQGTCAVPWTCGSLLFVRFGIQLGEHSVFEVLLVPAVHPREDVEHADPRIAMCDSSCLRDLFESLVECPVLGGQCSMEIDPVVLRLRKAPYARDDTVPAPDPLVRGCYVSSEADWKGRWSRDR